MWCYLGCLYPIHPSIQILCQMRLRPSPLVLAPKSPIIPAPSLFFASHSSLRHLISLHTHTHTYTYTHMYIYLIHPWYRTSPPLTTHTYTHTPLHTHILKGTGTRRIISPSPPHHGSAHVSLILIARSFFLVLRNARTLFPCSSCTHTYTHRQGRVMRKIAASR